MKKLSLLVLALFASITAYGANTIEYRDDSLQVTSSQIATTAANSTTPVDLGPYQAGAVQCAWAAVTGTQPAYKLQVSNNQSNWDDVSGAATTTTSSSGSATYMVDPFVARQARILITTTGTGTLDCITILK